MRLELKAAGSKHSPRGALEELRKLMHVRLTLPGKNRRYDVLANKHPVQQQLFRALEIDPLTDARLRRILLEYGNRRPDVLTSVTLELRPGRCQSRGASWS